jgi:dihydropteroate synthase
VITALRGKSGALVSIDTRHSHVAEKALEHGADMVNDVSSLASGPRMAEVAAGANAGLVLMHMKGTPETMQQRPTYRDVAREVTEFLSRAVRRAEAAGVPPSSIVIDPGIGFGKTVQHNLELLNGLPALSELGKPILVGVSRKTFIGRVLDVDVGPEHRLFGTAAAVSSSIMRGAHLVRVHDVPEMAQVARMCDAILKASSTGDDGIGGRR